MMILLHHHELVTIICSIAGDPCGTILEAKPVSLEEYAKALKLPKWQSFWNTGKVRLQKQVHPTHSAMPVDASQTQVWDQSHWSWNYIGIESWAAGTSAML